MAIPDFESIMRPLLSHLADSADHTTADTIDDLARDFGLNQEDLSELLPSGKQARFKNRVAWAKFYLKKAGLVENPRRGVYRISLNGLAFLHTHSGAIDVESLQTIQQFREFLASSQKAEESDTAGPAAATSEFVKRPQTQIEFTPQELLETAYSKLTGQLAAELLDRIKNESPTFFEDLVLDLILSLGYGGSRRDAGKRVGSTGDGGIDGVINQDPLGLETVYIQAKRWDGTVGRPEVQKFAGALQGRRANKGIFITTSSFSKDAVDYVGTITNKIVLIDGERLTRLLIDHGVGVSSVTTYEVKRIDSDYFAEE